VLLHVVSSAARARLVPLEKANGFNTCEIARSRASVKDSDGMATGPQPADPLNLNISLAASVLPGYGAAGRDV
jgi:hypothetical protein